MVVQGPGGAKAVLLTGFMKDPERGHMLKSYLQMTLSFWELRIRKGPDNRDEEISYLF